MAGSAQSVQRPVLLSVNWSFALFRLAFLLLLHARLLADEPSPFSHSASRQSRFTPILPTTKRCFVQQAVCFEAPRARNELSNPRPRRLS